MHAASHFEAYEWNQNFSLCASHLVFNTKFGFAITSECIGGDPQIVPTPFSTIEQFIRCNFVSDLNSMHVMDT